MIEVRKDFTFDAAHFLPGYAGACNDLHGHTYRLEVTLKGKIDPLSGMVYDFKNLKTLVEERILQHLDHKYLNNVETPGFPQDQPTAENMVVWIGKRLYTYLLNQPNPITVSKVALWETPTSCAIWRNEYA